MARSKRSGGEGGGPVAAATGTEFVLYQTDDGLARVQVRLHEGAVWLTQRDLADLYQVKVPTLNEHLRNLYAEGELAPEATIRQYLTVRTEGNRSVSRLVDHYALLVVLAVGYRVRSPRGTQFRQWATARLSEYLVTGFTLDDERLKQAGNLDYFDELLARIRDIRSSEKVFYKKVLAIYATSVDYDPSAEASQRFFATVQNRLHYAVPRPDRRRGHRRPRRRCQAEHGPHVVDRRATAAHRRARRQETTSPRTNWRRSTASSPRTSSSPSCRP